MAHIGMVVRHGDTYRLAGVDDQPKEDALDEETKVRVEGDESGANIGCIPPTFSGVGPSRSVSQDDTDILNNEV
ncbi:hypothetical protein JCGZ_16661 [Jatropha curcas]|uniref:Uncharacterized protein n=1 Tax=Jatropha curcas TaxID=180498 RepID=A0A067KEL3_JATCU|nr:hypothetical protein JCGZ_16661 [Jatropha curcas]